MLKILLQFITLFFLYANNSFSYHPSLESLLNNGLNVEIGSSSVVGNFIVEEKNAEKKLFMSSETSIQNKHAIKLHIYNGSEQNPILARIHYSGAKFSNSTLINYDESALWNTKKLIGHNENVEAEIFYGLMAMLLNNQGRPLLNKLKGISGTLKSNRDLFDSEKMQLLARYKEYLIKKRDSADNVEIENPLEPENQELQEKVREILERPFLTKDNEIKRVKDGKEFYWIVDDENLFVKFDKNHHMKELKIKTSIGQIEIILGKFVIWTAQMEFPEFILFKTVENKWYEIKPQKISLFNDNKDLYDRRLKSYQKQSEENKIDNQISRPAFLF